MAKGILDALQGFTYRNDGQIDHLDLVRIEAAADSEGLILIRLQSTRLNDDETFFDTQQPEVANFTADAIDLRSYSD